MPERCCCGGSIGIYGFAIGYTAGSCGQLVLVYSASRRDLREARADGVPWPRRSSARDLLGKPGIFLAYAGLLALNMIVTRAYATHAGTGMAASFDYCIRCVNVVIAYLVSPASNSLLPEIARLHAAGDDRRAVRLVDRTAGFASIAAVAACVVGSLVRTPIISLLFERGSFTAHSTRTGVGRLPGTRAVPDRLQPARTDGPVVVRAEPAACCRCSPRRFR